MKVKQLNRRTTMRVNAGFSRLLRLDGIWVRRVQFNARPGGGVGRAAAAAAVPVVRVLDAAPS